MISNASHAVADEVIPQHRVSLQSVSTSLEERPSSLAVDLVQIAASLYAIDRSSARGRGWRRALTANLSVQNLDNWRNLGPKLASALGVLTDDNWTIKFSQGRGLSPEERQPWLFKLDDRGITSLALFSGGLDSFAGAAIWLDRHPDDILGLVSVTSSTVIGKIQKDLVQLLVATYPERVFHLIVPLNLVRAAEVERSQRIRGFVYTAIAAATASCAGVERVLIFENGYGSLNPRLVEHQIGAQATKSTHPYPLEILADIYRQVGLGVRLELPNENQTKAEVLTAMPEELRPGIRITVSCDSFPLRRKGEKQCGYCGSCILRQQSLRSAGLDEYDRDDYLESPWQQTHTEHLLLMAYQARQFIEITSSTTPAEAVRRWPEIGLGEETQHSLRLIERLGLLSRYGLEWQRLVHENPDLAKRVGWRVD
jgi:hypothetical protein